MAIHIQDKKTDGLVRDFARRRGLGITDAVKTAVEEANQKDGQRLEEMKRRLEPIWREIRARRQNLGPHDDKAFMDEMWGEDP